MYKALPDCLTIDKSKIHGLGLFATEDIGKDTNLGISHVKNTSSKFENNYVRTPLGGCINHSDDPNCIKFIPNVVVAPDVKVSLPDYMSLKTIRKIRRGEELTVTYTLYSIEEDKGYDEFIVIDEYGGYVKIEKV
tara:strand:+ start:293 stop:697 length:405 start_codon:yes stop_codon:yes gene_type:complete